MPPISIIVLVLAIVLVSYKGFNDGTFFNRYKFQVNAIANGKQYDRLITSGFLHGDWTHLLFNMLTLYFFYGSVMYYTGTHGFFIIYFGSLLISGVVSLFYHRNEPYYSAIGASGAVSGVLFSAIILNPGMSLYLMFIPIPIPGWLFAIAYMGYSLYGMKHRAGNIGHSAHLGGAIAGVILTVLLEPGVIAQQPLLVGGLFALSLGLLLFGERILKR